jgi:hypothetical protein
MCVSSEEMTANVRLRGGGALKSARIEHEEDKHVLENVIHERASIKLERRLRRMQNETRRQAGSGEFMVSSCNGRGARQGPASADAARDPKEMTNSVLNCLITPSFTSHECRGRMWFMRARGGMLLG